MRKFPSVEDKRELINTCRPPAPPAAGGRVQFWRRLTCCSPYALHTEGSSKLPTAASVSPHPLLVLLTCSHLCTQLTLYQHGLNYTDLLICGFFSMNTCIVFDLQLGVHGYEGPTMYIDLHHFIRDLSIYRFWYLRES